MKIRDRLRKQKRTSQSLKIRKIDEAFFSLDNVLEFPHNLLFQDEQLKSIDTLMLILATVWNDLKNNLLFWEVVGIQKSEIKNEEQEIGTGRAGQISGMEIYLIKSTLSIFYGFFEIKKKRGELFNDDKFRGLLTKLSVDNQNRWKVLLDETPPEMGAAIQKFSKVATLVRNNIGYHYYDQNDWLAKGYDRFFKEHDQKAQFSSGKSMEASRYYFADASNQAALDTFFQPLTGKDFGELHRDFFSIFNKAIRSLFEAYLEERAILPTLKKIN